MRAEATMEVGNPFAERVPLLRNVRGVLSYHEDRIRVERALRNDPLGSMHARGQITEVRYRAGREWQRYARLVVTVIAAAFSFLAIRFSRQKRVDSAAAQFDSILRTAAEEFIQPRIRRFRSAVVASSVRIPGGAED